MCRLITRVVFPLELASFGIAVFSMSATVPSLWAMAGLYAMWLEVLRRRRKRLGLSMSPISYDLLSDFYFVYWPLWLAMALSVREPVLLAVLAFNILWLLPAIRFLIGNAVRLFGAAAPWRRGAAMALAKSPAGVTTGDFRSMSSAAGGSDDGKSGYEIHRNQPCPCGSGKKYKHCHGRYA
jgi:hypothetical protein